AAGAVAMRGPRDEAAHRDAAASESSSEGDAGRPSAPAELPSVAAESERVAWYARVLATGDEDEVGWAKERLRATGAAGRAIVREQARSSLETNPALLQQALEFLAVDAEPEDLVLARDALASDDPQAVTRALRIVAAVAKPDDVATLRA